MPERIQDVWLAFAFLAWSGLHILLRLLSLHMCNEYLSLQKKKKKKKKNDPLSHGGWQAGRMLRLEGVLQDRKQLRAKQIPELSEELIRQAI